MDEKQALQFAQQALRLEDKATAQQYLRQAIQANPRSETAWLWLSAMVGDPAKERDCLKRVLSINPHNELARKHLAELDRTNPPPSQSVPPLFPVTAPPPPPSSPQPAPPSAQRQQTAGKKRKRLPAILIVAIVVAIPLVLCCLFSYLSGLVDQVDQTTPTPMSPEARALATCRIKVVGYAMVDFSLYDQAVYIGNDLYTVEGYYTQKGVRWDYGCTVARTDSGWVAVDSWKSPH
jgi:tetratricopeptide (TPR) repeat protein